jgi:hypothetical protein
MAMPSNMSTSANNTMNTSSTNENYPQIFAIAEFASLESELKLFLQGISKNNGILLSFTTMRSLNALE